MTSNKTLNIESSRNVGFSERERERGLLIPSIGFRGRDIASLAAALGPLVCLGAALGPLACLAAAFGP